MVSSPEEMVEKDSRLEMVKEERFVRVRASGTFCSSHLWWRGRWCTVVVWT